MSQTLIHDIIRQLREIQNGSRWFDQCINEKLSEVPEADAFKRPSPHVHSVAEHVSHMLAWRDECLLRFSGKKTALMNSEADWVGNDILKTIGWENLKKRIIESTGLLISVLENQDDSFLAIQFQQEEYNNHYLIEGIIQHDIYHLGQIGVTIKLLKQTGL